MSELCPPLPLFVQHIIKRLENRSEEELLGYLSCETAEVFRSMSYGST
jgi:hypothetical protein